MIDSLNPDGTMITPPLAATEKLAGYDPADRDLFVRGYHRGYRNLTPEDRYDTDVVYLDGWNEGDAALLAEANETP